MENKQGFAKIPLERYEELIKKEQAFDQITDEMRETLTELKQKVGKMFVGEHEVEDDDEW